MPGASNRIRSEIKKKLLGRKFEYGKIRVPNVLRNGFVQDEHIQEF